jgi:hypothetical protein
MKRSMSFLALILFVSMLSGCIISANPTNKSTVIIDPSEKKVFQIDVFPFNPTCTWKLDDVVVQQGKNNKYSYSPLENVVGKQTLVVEAKTVLGTDIYAWNIDTTLSAPSDQKVIDDYLGGEQPIQITTLKYEGMVILPQGLNVRPDTLVIKSGVAGVTPISGALKSAVSGAAQNSNTGVFNAEMNSNATALMSVEDGNGEVYLMKLFPKSEDIREVNPVIDTKSTAVSLIALQPGVITGVPNIDAIILELIRSLPETQALANQIDSEYSAGIFKLDGHFSNEILTRMGACYDALNKLKLEDVISGTTGTKSLFQVPNLIMLDFPVEWDCADDDTPVFHDTDGVDTDGVCVNASINLIGQPSSFTMHNKYGRWAVLGVEQPGGELYDLDWVLPRHFQLPSASEILVAVGKLTYAGAKQFVNKIFNVHDNGDTFMDTLKEIITSYVGLTSSQSTYTFTSASEYSMAVVGAHLGVSYSNYQNEIYKSIFSTTITEILVPFVSIILEINQEDASNKVKDSISNDACAEGWEQLLIQLPGIISDVNESIEEDGPLKGTGKFLVDFVGGTLCSEDGLRLVNCFLKHLIDVQQVRALVTQKFLSLASNSFITPYVEAYNKSIALFNFASSSLMFIYVLNSDTITCVDEYTVDLSHSGITFNKTFGGSSWDKGLAVKQTSDGGYILVGSMIGNACLIKTDAYGNKLWEKTYGGPSIANAVLQTSDGGYILAGIANWAGNEDAWLIKTDANGNKLWDKTFGGSNWDEAHAVLQTSDGGYIVAGCTESYGAGGWDAWIIKTDADGNNPWDRTYGGFYEEWFNDVWQTSDGGYILAGAKESAEGQDAWLIKTDSNGNKLWDKIFGGSNSDTANSIQQTSDGGYILAGYTASYGAGNYDAWLVKTNRNGNNLWDKTYGGFSTEGAYSIQQTSDGGYILAGYTASYGAGNGDAWLVKTDANGNKLWDKAFGGYYYDIAKAVQQTSDGGYILVGSSNIRINGVDRSVALLIKTDAEGNAPATPTP